jgi:hypothetical protein
MDKTSGRNFVIRFFPKSLAIGQTSSKTVIAFEGKPISAYSFRLFLLSLGPTYGQDITSKAIYKLVTFPRESRLWTNYEPDQYKHFHNEWNTSAILNQHSDGTIK